MSRRLSSDLLKVPARRHTCLTAAKTHCNNSHRHDCTSLTLRHLVAEIPKHCVEKLDLLYLQIVSAEDNHVASVKRVHMQKQHQRLQDIQQNWPPSKRHCQEYLRVQTSTVNEPSKLSSGMPAHIHHKDAPGHRREKPAQCLQHRNRCKAPHRYDYEDRKSKQGEDAAKQP